MRIPITLYLHNSKKVNTLALLDSGATECFINQSLVDTIQVPLRRLPYNIPVYNVDGTENRNGTIEHSVTIDYWLGEEANGQLPAEDLPRKKQRFQVTSLGKERIILGYSWLEKENPHVD